MFKRWRKTKPQNERPKTTSAFTTDVYSSMSNGEGYRPAPTLEWEQPSVDGITTDSNTSGTVPSFKGMSFGIPEAQASWYMSQSFIGYSMCALIAKHWLVDKAITMPGRDAIRQGYRIDGKGDDLVKLENKTRKREINSVMRDYINTGRRTGGAAALFVVDSTDPEYYEKPFNIDGVIPGQYKGIKVIDASWMTPELIAENVQDPASLKFYVPTFWRIGSKKYHHSHFCFYAPYPVADVVKPTYRFFGVSVPERIYERVYAAERTANEAPQLALTKRLLTLGINNLGDADKEAVAQNMTFFMEMRDNYGVNVGDKEDNFQQFDTALGDLDNTIMTQYQLVAAGANVPATKLLETTPKGFNSSGEYEEAAYREGLESIQTNDLEPLLDRHLELLVKHEGLRADDLTIVWEPLDSPTAKEYAEIALAKAQAATAYAGTGAIDGADIRKQLSEDRNSDFYGLESESDIDISGWLTDETNRTAGTVGEESQGRNAGGQTAGLPGVSESTVRTPIAGANTENEQ